MGVNTADDCIVMTGPSNFQWFDNPCTTLNRYVCQVRKYSCVVS